jgi:Mlc titration factor MtfA (ptsG expression regulator)
MSVFLDEISFEACGGLPEVTDQMCLVIAAQACLLLLESGYEDFGRLRSVLIYPDAYQAGDDDGSGDVRLGESWQTGSVVLSWQSVVEGARNPEDGRNVVLHEFAHQIDQFDGDADGLPLLKRKGDYRKWAEAFNVSYELLCERVNAGRKTVLDPYGATNPAEFFAVATETFFEKPKQLQREHAAVYAELRAFYGLDPVTWDDQ